MREPDITAIKNVLSYCHETGRLTWAAKRFGVKVGTEAGTIHKGYRRIKIFGTLVLSHRVAWAIYYGQWPSAELDHINRNKSDNRITNLRESSRSDNMINRKYPRGESGITGVSKHRCGWQATIRINKKSVHLGLFKDIESAAIARTAAEKLIYKNIFIEG